MPMAHFPPVEGLETLRSPEWVGQETSHSKRSDKKCTCAIQKWSEMHKDINDKKDLKDEGESEVAEPATLIRT